MLRLDGRPATPATPARPCALACPPRALPGRRPAPARAAGGEGRSQTPAGDVGAEGPRPSVPTPTPAPIEHSSTYLLRSRRGFEEEPQASTSQQREPFTGNAVQWYLRKLDKKVSEDDAMQPAAMAFYKASQTPAGSTAVKNVGSVMGQAAKLGGNALKAAAPVGRWALMQGLNAAGKALSSYERAPQRKELPPQGQPPQPPKDDSPPSR